MTIRWLLPCLFLPTLILQSHHKILANAKIVGGAVIPHGDFAYDPSLVHGKNGSKELHKAALRVGRWIEQLEPDVILLSTPHGMELAEDFLIYQNDMLNGCAELGGDLHNKSFPSYKVCANLTTDAELATSLVQKLEHKQRLTGILGFANSMPLPVSWGEILPYSFLPAEFQPKVIILGIPYSRYNHSVDMVPELVDLGFNMGHILDESPKRVVLVVSSDLAHTHQIEGPYGYCPCAQPFDDASGAWASTMDSWNIRNKAAKQQALGAKSCGFPGMVLFDGLLDVIRNGSGTPWRSQLMANFHPTYYGMMIARFGPESTFT